MKRLIIAVVSALALTACDRGLRFEVEFHTNYPDATFYLTPNGQPTNYYLKSTSDSEGVVRFEGRMRQPVVACISDGYVLISRPFFVEQGSIKFGHLSEQSPEIVAFGTPSNDAYNEYLVRMQALEKRYTFSSDSTTNPSEDMLRAFDSLGLAVQRANMDNIFGVYLFVNEGIHRATAEQIDSIVAEFSPAMRRHPYVEEAVAAKRQNQ
ncbi:MAG: hypothetical protein J6K81_06925 [Rikenellaceae bacterium]|nr:hypothetical protein [Rikenellaceae bacterium]